MVVIKKAVDHDLPEIAALLELVNLSVEGVDDHFRDFLVAYEGYHLVGCIGIEIYVNVGLIRSVAVHHMFQGHGLGRELVRRMEHISIDKGLERLYLITETARRFFSLLGYVTIPRDTVDAKVKQSIEYTKVCATSGICMMKNLKQNLI